jgi:hypothetical protein
MPTDITISTINGQDPFDVYVCDSGITVCYYVDTINSGDLPFTFQVPIIYSNLTSFNIKVVDDNNCPIDQIVIV